MNDEIKEILDYWKFYINEPSNYKLLNVHFDEIKKVLDYITNLQQENERLKEWKEDLLNENIELENIRKEAIEYIKNDWYKLNTRDIEHCINLGKDIRIDLLNILQNGSDKQ